MTDEKPVSVRFVSPVTLGALAMLCGACAATGPGAASDARAVNQTVIQESRAVRIAETLAKAEAAYASGDTEQLGELVTALKASGLRSLGEKDPEELAVWSRAAGVETLPYRGRLLGPAYVRGELAPGEVWRSAQTFKSGESSTLSVSHRGDGPVRMTVSDKKARAVCTPSRMAGPPCRFTPVFTQRYNIELRNEGEESTVYFLVFD